MTYTGLQDQVSANPMLVAFELSKDRFLARGWWQGRESGVSVASTAEGLAEAIATLKRRFKVSGEVTVVACYEAGREGFWPARCLERLGVGCRVLEPSSIEVPRRARRAKTDRLDVAALLRLLVRAEIVGEKRVFKQAQVPPVEVEADRRLNRERERLVEERRAHAGRIQSLLVTQGIRWSSSPASLELGALRDWEGEPLSSRLQQELEREQVRWRLVDEQLATVDRLMKQAREAEVSRIAQVARQLIGLRAIGPVGSWTLSAELFAWRALKNRRQVAAATGLAPVPFDSGDSRRDQGISKAGPGRLRALLVELAWGWLRYQPNSELSLWYERRFAHGGKRLRRIGIVALARRLAIALWRYVEYGELPAGAELKAG